MQRWVRSGLIGLGTAFLGAVLILADGSERLNLGFERDMGLSWMFVIRGPAASPADVAVIGLNSESGKSLGLPPLPRDWPRTVHGRILGELVRQDSGPVIFDYDFSRPKDAEDDRAFAEDIAKSRRVILLQRLNGIWRTVYDKDGNASQIWFEEAQVPAPPIGDGARGMGPFVLPKVDQAAHQFWTFKASAGDAPTTVALAAQLYALPSYGAWRRVLEQAGMEGVAELPADAEAVSGHVEMAELMGRLRRAFTRDAGLKGRVDAVLAGPIGQGLSAEERRMVNALASLYAGPEVRYLNFYGPPGTVATYPYEAMLPSDYQGPRPPVLGDLAGRAVFAGYSDLGQTEQPDRYYTVFTNERGIDLSGVEIMATALANLLDDRTVTPAGPWVSLGAVLGFGLLAGVLVYAFPALVSVPLTLLLAGLYGAGVQWLFEGQALWLPWATPLMVQTPFALLTGLLAQYLLERRKVQTFAEALEIYVPENVVRGLAGAGVDSDSVNQVVFGTCLANDMSGFSTVSEGKTPKELARFMNAYFDAMAQPLIRNGVDVTEFHADTIMCAWTKDQDKPAARRAVIVGAIGVLDAMRDFNQIEQVSLSARIGLQDGSFYLGHTGGGGRMAYSILGDPANTASRLEGLNKHLGTKILAAASVTEGVEGILTRPVGWYQLVGKAEGTPAVQVVGLADEATDDEHRFCEDFTAALSAFRAGEWAEAGAGFDALLARRPEDRPATIHAERCRACLAGDMPEGEPWVIRMVSK